MASEIFKQNKFAEYHEVSKAVTNATTQMHWADAESFANDCEAAKAHMRNVFPLLELIADSHLRNQVADDVARYQGRIDAVCGK
jgi:hypothetical protein